MTAQILKSGIDIEYLRLSLHGRIRLTAEFRVSSDMFRQGFSDPMLSASQLIKADAI
jgi:hypothetical protein